MLCTVPAVTHIAISTVLLPVLPGTRVGLTAIMDRASRARWKVQAKQLMCENTVKRVGGE